MVTATPKKGWPIPELSDPPDGVEQIGDLGRAIEQDIAVASVTTWSPGWTSSGSPKPSGASSITGRYSLSQGWCDFGFSLSMSGSTTGGVGQWQFILPFSGNAALGEQVVYGKLFEPQVGNFPLHGLIFAGSNLLWCYCPVGPAQAQFTGLQQSDGVNPSNTFRPAYSPGPLQAGGNVVFTGRYLIA